ncbi:MAG: hypothetical protein U9R25_10340 [Chloroflexota bacterium]|nr:hypothetical protein [Chloroflexota bacterium]
MRRDGTIPAHGCVVHQKVDLIDPPGVQEALHRLGSSRPGKINLAIGAGRQESGGRCLLRASANAQDTVPR